MSASDAFGDLLRRHWVAIATADYDDPSWARLAGVHDEVKALEQWLCDSGLHGREFTALYPELACNPTLDAIEDDLRRTGWNEADAAFVYLTGHGETVDGAHRLVLHNSCRSKLGSLALRTSDVVAWLAGTTVEYLLLIVDTCTAGAVAEDIAKRDHPLPRGWLVLGSAAKGRSAVARSLTSAITEFLTELASPVGEKYGLEPYIRVDHFLSALDQRLGDEQPLQWLNPNARPGGPHPCLPNPRYRQGAKVSVKPARRDLAWRSDDFVAHWDPKARGTADEKGWLFCGRAVLMKKLVAWTNAKPRALVVSGSAGCGKSAVLARLVTLSDPDFVADHAQEVGQIPDVLRPKVGAVDVALHAQNKLPHDVLGQLCTALDIQLPAGATTTEALLDAWWSWLSDRTTPVTVIVDALDEASYPEAVLHEVLAKLEPSGGLGRKVRLLVGVRSPGGGGPLASPTGSHSRLPLADLVEERLRAERLRADEPPLWEEGDIIEYATAVLRLATGSPYGGDDELKAARAVGAVIGTKAGTSFLVARLAAAMLAGRAERLASDDASLATALEDGVTGVLREDLCSSVPDQDDRLRAVHLLRAAAFSYGRGLPWNQIWPRVATAVADDPERTYGDQDIAWLLRSRLGGFLVTDREDDVTVYRPCHDALRAILKERWRDLLAER